MTAIRSDFSKTRGADAISHDAGKRIPARSALTGCRVLEISADAGAVAGRILADLGADVVKIEPPAASPRGDRIRPLRLRTDRGRAAIGWR